MEGILYWAERKNDGKMVHISGVLNGRQCNCVCPACGSSIVARQGSIYAWHFAHQGEHHCKHALETALHRLAKEIIRAGTSMRLPVGRQFNYTCVSLEKPMQGIRSDACVENGTEQLLIEIFVSSEVTPRKEQLILSLGLPAVEIDISQVRRDISEAELRFIILEQTDNKRMLAIAASDSQAREYGVTLLSHWFIVLLIAILVAIIAIATRNRRPLFPR